MPRFELKGKVNLDTTGVHAGIRRTEQALGNLKSSITKVAGFLGIAFGGQQLKAIADYGTKIFELARRTKLTTDEVQKLSYAAEQDGASIDTVTKAIELLGVAQLRAADGSKTDREAFKAFGLSMEDVAQMNPSALFLKLSDKIHDTGGSAEYTTAALKVMGESAGQLLPAMVSGFSQTADEFERLNLGIDNLDITRLKELTGELTQIEYKAKRIGAELIVGLANQARNISDFLKIGLGVLPATLGALSGGASVTEALDAGGNVAKDVIDKRIAKDRATKKMSESTASGAVPSETETLAEKTKGIGATFGMASTGGSGASELQRIGAFVFGSSGNLTIQQKQVSILEDIRDAIRRGDRTIDISRITV